jgi:hypothetical protein
MLRSQALPVSSPVLLTNRISVSVLALFAIVTPAYADGPSLNYETLSSIEEPLATEVGDVTLLLRGVLDLPLSADLENTSGTDVNFTGNFEVNAETQMSNQWTVGVTYFGQYQTDRDGTDDKYSDNVAAYVGGIWGRVIAGNVSGIVREETRRERGVGNASLSFDDNYGQLDDLGGAYVGRYGPVVLSAVIDEDAKFDLGVMFQRPLGNKDYRLTARVTEGTYTSSDGTMRFDTTGVSTVAELVYGSFQFDVGAGYETFSSTTLDAERWYVSTGARTKVDVVSISAEGHFGEVEGQEEVSAALGLQYDIARGLSANLGFNYAYAPISFTGVTFNNKQDTKGIVSLRYSF